MPAPKGPNDMTDSTTTRSDDDCALPYARLDPEDIEVATFAQLSDLYVWASRAQAEAVLAQAEAASALEDSTADLALLTEVVKGYIKGGPAGRREVAAWLGMEAAEAAIPATAHPGPSARILDFPGRSLVPGLGESAPQGSQPHVL